MSFIIGKACVDCMDTACASACPVNCGACVPECPVSAIYEDEDLAIKAGDEESVYKNYGFFGLKYA
jgi:NAD-dependent dihydropyrimidine dehydrogenase PreA subunit